MMAVSWLHRGRRAGRTWPPRRTRPVAIYVAKYHEAMSSEGLTPEQALADFSTVIRITPTRARSY